MLEVLTAIKLGQAVLKRLKSVENREELIKTLISSMGDGKISPTEWAVIGKQLGVYEGKANK